MWSCTAEYLLFDSISKASKARKIQRKNANIFLSISLTTCFGCSKELSYWDGSFEYPQHMFWLRNKKIIFSYTFLSGGLCLFLVMEGTDLSIFDDVGDNALRNQDDEDTLDQLEWELASQSGRITGKEHTWLENSSETRHIRASILYTCYFMAEVCL